MQISHDIEILRALAHEYMEIANLPVQDERRRLWSSHFSLKPVTPPVEVSIGYHNKWCMQYFGDSQMMCESPMLRQYERTLKMALFQSGIGDDTIVEPWLTVNAAVGDGWYGLWGVESRRIPSETPGGAWKYDPVIRNCADAANLQIPHHFINEEATRREVEQLEDAVGDIIPINIHRGPRCLGFASDIITILCFLRGLEQVRNPC